MKIITLIAVWDENPRQVERLVSEAALIGPVVIQGDYRDPRGVSFIPDAASYRRGHWSRERDKRNALLEQARLDLQVDPEDWFLSLDPDEKLLHGDVLPEILDRISPELPAYPIPRLEPDGKVLAMACKCFRASVVNYEHLDVFVRWRGEVWDLDPVYTPAGDPVMGWPLIVHYRSLRADRAAPGGFYSDTPRVATRHFHHEWDKLRP